MSVRPMAFVSWVIACLLGQGVIAAPALVDNAKTSWTPVGAEANGTAAIQALVERRLPSSLHNAFTFTLANVSSSSENITHDPFIVTFPTSYSIHITSPTTSGLSRGLLTYLRSIGGDISWSSSTLTDHLLATTSNNDDSQSNNSTIEGSSWAEIRYLFNVVTYSYTMAFWQWDQWEYLLDWASLHGVNMPLAIGGQEYIWAEVYRDLGLPEEQILPYFSGPAFESWFRMGNIHGSWGMNVTSSWIEKQWALQKRIVTRMLALGMTPVLPAFNGFVPKGLQEHIGGPTFLKASNWEGFPVAYTNNSAIDPTWSTWQVMQKTFLQKQLDLYGGWTSHYYSIDLYNELQPTSLDLGYLKNNTQSVVHSIRTVDPSAVWVMQGWLFVNDPKSWNETTIPALLSGAQNDEMLILDLASEAIPAWNETDSYYGKQWVWNSLVNYGQNQGLYGSLDHYTTEVIRAQRSSPSLVGTGLTMEGMNNNEIVFELALDSPWLTSAIDPSTWIDDFITRRYGLGLGYLQNASSPALQAWQLLATSAYNNTNYAVQGVIKSPLELLPSSTGILNRTGHHPTLLTYDPSMITAALDKLIEAGQAAPGLMEMDGYAYDLVDVTRQVMINAGIPIYTDMIEAYNTTSPNMTKVAESGGTLVSLLKDIDTVLYTNKNFLLSSWISDARSFSDNKTEQAFLEYEGRNQITLWGTGSASWPLNRYSSRQWAGVVGDYYGTSWEMFVGYLQNTSVSQYNQTTFSNSLLDFEYSWEQETWGSQANQTWGVSGKSVLATVSAMREKWAAYL